MPTQNVSMSNEVYDIIRSRQSERGGTFSGALDNLVRLAVAHMEMNKKSLKELEESMEARNAQ